MRLTSPLLALAASIALTTPASAEYRDTSVPMRTQEINLQSYLGKWYEVARYPNSFERGCQAPTATYSLKDNGAVEVLNACASGKSRTAEAVKVGPGKLEVDFLPWLPGIAKGDYWVLYVDPGYTLAVVGEPSGRYGWVLSRSPQIRQSQLDQAQEVLTKNGYDLSGLMLIAQ